jgi:hypothetical protein
MRVKWFAVGLGLLAAVQADAQPAVLDGVTFNHHRGLLFVPIRPVAEAFGWSLTYDAESRRITMNGRSFNPPERLQANGAALIAVRDLSQWGLGVEWDEDAGRAKVSRNGSAIFIRRGQKKAVVDRSEQVMRAWQGEMKVFEAPVSTGRLGHETPRGTWPAGPYRARMHYSSLYDNAPMPWSVQVTGHYFIHGFESVPDRPASAGCIRLPLWGMNPARWFYHWIENGNPITIE